MLRTIQTISLIGLALAVPTLEPRADTTGSTIDDTTILNYALTLEHLEAAFYKQGLNKFNKKAFSNAKQPAWVRERVTEIASHEKAHVDFLTKALKAVNVTPVAPCTYDFSPTKGMTNVAGFLATAQALEGVGVAAYLGAAANITDPAYLTYAGSVLTIEARHNAWIRADVMHGDAFPQPFETPLDFNQVYSIASNYIKSCPSTNPALPVKVLPKLNLVSARDAAGHKKLPSALCSGDLLKFTTDVAITGKTFINFLQVTGAISVPFTAGKEIAIPKGLFGQTYIILSSVEGGIKDADTLAGPYVVELPLNNRNFKY